MNILMILLIAIEIILGLGTTALMLGELFYTLGLKIYRKVKYGSSLYD